MYVYKGVTGSSLEDTDNRLPKWDYVDLTAGTVQ